MKLVVAAVRPTPILWRRASEPASPTEVPASTLPARGIAPVRANIASKSVVLPLWKGPTSPIHRGPRGLLTSCPIAASSFGARPLIGSAKPMLPLHRGFGKPEKRRCGALLRRRSTAVIASDSEAIQPHTEETGLLRRGACHRGRVRATRWLLAMTTEQDVHYRPGRSSRLSSPAATLRPTWPCTLSGCSAIELFEPPTSALPPAPTPTAALPSAPA